MGVFFLFQPITLRLTRQSIQILKLQRHAFRFIDVDESESHSRKSCFILFVYWDMQSPFHFRFHDDA